jgi:predicted transcriptional regulator
MRTKRFGSVLPVRLSNDVERKLCLVAEAAGVSKSDVMRMAISYGLPSLEAGRFKLNFDEVAPKRKRSKSLVE